MKLFDEDNIYKAVKEAAKIALEEGADALLDVERLASSQVFTDYMGAAYVSAEINRTTANEKLECRVISSSKESIWSHFGTGIFGASETAPHRQTWWVYCTDPDGDYIGTGRKEPYYSYNQAQYAVAALRAKGKDAYCTQGREPTYFFSRAFEDNKSIIEQIIKDTFYEEIKYI